MLARNLTPGDVLARLTKLEEDSEGVLYKDEREQMFLFVVCPSTKREYLLSVPNWHVADTPAKARRWTFNLPADAVFADET